MKRSARLSLKRKNGLHKRPHVTEIPQQKDVHLDLYSRPTSSQYVPLAVPTSDSTSNCGTAVSSRDGDINDGPELSSDVDGICFLASECNSETSSCQDTLMSCEPTVSRSGHQMESERAVEEVKLGDDLIVPSSSVSLCSKQEPIEDVDRVIDPLAVSENTTDMMDPHTHDYPLPTLSSSEMARFEDFSVPHRSQGANPPVHRQTSLFSFMSRTHRSLSTSAVQVTDESEDHRRLAAHRSSVGELQRVVEKGEAPALHQYNTAGSQVSERNDRAKRMCPFYKRIPGTKFSVDAFSYGSIPDCSAYFLSHFHSDHYMGLTRKFQHPIYCSKVTANLVQQKLRVSQQYVHALDMNTPHIIDGVQVTLLDANHCPGSVLFLFKLASGRHYLHTGDFRFFAGMKDYPQLKNVTINQLFLDTTYCSPEYTFPRQEEVIAFAVDKAAAALHTSPGTLLVCGSYTIGKERVFMGLALTLGLKVYVNQEKRAILECCENPEILSVLTSDQHSAGIHVLPMSKLNMNDMCLHLEQNSSKFTSLLAFKPTGWTYSSKAVSLASIKPQSRGPITIYGIPYSEHSSFSELRQFVQFVRPQTIIPTVNNHSAKKRDDMQKHFKQWLTNSQQQTRTKQTTLFNLKS